MTAGTLNVEAMKDTLDGSEQGRMTFPEVVRQLLDAGVESYFADMVRGVHTFYLPDGETHVEKRALPLVPVSPDFSEVGLVAAIRGAQADKIRYPEFVKQASAAGVAAYWVFLTGKRAVYFGRKGEIHIEEFPGASS
jgi:uncharacterized protein YbcV (DUF1398 family)